MTEKKNFQVNLKQFDSVAQQHTDEIKKTGNVTGTDHFMGGFAYAGPWGADTENGVDFYDPDQNYLSMCDLPGYQVDHIEINIPAGATTGQSEEKILEECMEHVEGQEGYCMFFYREGSLHAMIGFTDLDVVRGFIYGLDWFGCDKETNKIKYLFLNGTRVDNIDAHLKA
jgi:hypothetical protein